MQLKKHSWLEAWVNILVGYAVNFILNMLVFPLFGFNVTVTQNLLIGLIYMFVSVCRSYIMRRAFNRWTG